MVCGDTPTYGWVYVWVGQWVVSCQNTTNLINLCLIEKIQLCLKIYDFCRHPHLWVGLWVVWLMDQLMSEVMSNH